MKKSRFSEEQIATTLRQVDAEAPVARSRNSGSGLELCLRRFSPQHEEMYRESFLEVNSRFATQSRGRHFWVGDKLSDVLATQAQELPNNRKRIRLSGMPKDQGTESLRCSRVR